MESQERLSQTYSAAQHLGLSAELNTFLGAFNLVVLSEMITACVNKIDELGVTQSNIFLAVDSIVCKSSPSFLNDALHIHYRLNINSNQFYFLYLASRRIYCHKKSTITNVQCGTSLRLDSS